VEIDYETANLNLAKSLGKCGFEYTSMTLTHGYFTDLTGKKQEALLQRLRNRCRFVQHPYSRIGRYFLPNLKNPQFLDSVNLGQSKFKLVPNQLDY